MPATCAAGEGVFSVVPSSQVHPSNTFNSKPFPKTLRSALHVCDFRECAVTDSWTNTATEFTKIKVAAPCDSIPKKISVCVVVWPGFQTLSARSTPNSSGHNFPTRALLLIRSYLPFLDDTSQALTSWLRITFHSLPLISAPQETVCFHGYVFVRATTATDDNPNSAPFLRARLPVSSGLSRFTCCRTAVSSTSCSITLF